MVAKILKRFTELGVSGCVQALNRKARKKWMRVWHSPKYAPHKKIAREHINTGFLEKIISSQEFNLYLPQKFKNDNWILQQADMAAKNCFDILGSGIKCFEKIPWHQDFKSPDFSSDTSNTSNANGASNTNDTSNSTSISNTKNRSWQYGFYQDITASCPQKMSLDEYNSDIKIPWELSRFQHIFVLGRAYQIKSHELSSHELYSSAFQNQITDWIEQNPYLIGVNWVCPMDVAIRAINWIWDFYFFKDAPNISDKFWDKFVNTLYLHLHYLEFNWETSDKPNNHYLSDLLGYLYLCEFFGKSHGLKKSKDWCIKKMLEQFFHQIHPDGTCYEGTTSYHRLDTEIFLHFKLICAALQVSLPPEFLNRFDKMIEFLQACTDESGTDMSGTGTPDTGTLAPSTPDTSTPENFITIGDNDSGKILTGIKIPNPAGRGTESYERKELGSGSELHNYPDFGLVIIKKFGGQAPRAGMANSLVPSEFAKQICIEGSRCLHVSFRIPKFKQNQPTGHFHCDQLAVTLSINGTPILIDPGSYVYTANSTWRNLMRGPQSHNTFYSPDYLAGYSDGLNTGRDDLFQLKLTPQDGNPSINQFDGKIQVTACNKLSSYNKLAYCRVQTAYRMIEVDEEKNFKITDWWDADDRMNNNSFMSKLKRPARGKLVEPSSKGRRVKSSEWNLIFNPELKLRKENDKTWLVKKNDTTICRIFSTLDFVLLTGFYSENYGTLQKCPKLSATKIVSNEKQTILFTSNL